jgi:hypothetical protein
MTIIAGQPIDLQTIIDTINKVNTLETQLAQNSTQSSITGYDGVKTNYPASKISIEAANIKLDKTEANANQIAFSLTLTNFKKTPIVTATLVSTSNSTVVQDHSVVITEVTTSTVKGYVKFQASGTIPNTTVNIIAVGSPT